MRRAFVQLGEWVMPLLLLQLLKRYAMPMLLIGLIVVVAIAMLLTFGGDILRLVLMLAVAGVVGWLADAVVPGHLPWGRLGAVLAGLVGSWLGVWLLGLVGLQDVGPAIVGVPVVPAFVGAAVLAFLIELVGRSRARGEAT